MEGRPLDDTMLVRRAKEGDVGSYAELVRRYQGTAHRLAYLITGSAADADDATQEGFVKAYGALGSFREGAAFSPWLLRIVANQARNRRRAAGRRVRHELRVAEDRASGEAAPSPEAAVLAAEDRALLLAAVQALPDPHRQVVALRYFLGLSEAETASVLGVARGTVKSRHSRALASLRRSFTEAHPTAAGRTE